MVKQTIYIKNMCCQRCIDAVQAELNSLGLKANEIRLGEANFNAKLDIPMKTLEKKLKKRGFELIVSQEEQMVEAIKLTIMNLISSPSEASQKVHLPQYLEERLKKPYQQIHKLFSQNTNLSIEKYLILQRIEKVKELIQQNQLSFSEIAFSAGYKTQQHLSAQFKSVTGISMTKFKLMEIKPRKHIDKI